MLDTNFMGLNKSGNFINIEERIREDFLDVLRRDCFFLNAHSCIDYSLLLVMEKVNPDRLPDVSN